MKKIFLTSFLFVTSHFSYADNVENKRDASIAIDLLSLTFSIRKQYSDKWFIGPAFGIGIGVRPILATTNEHLSHDHACNAYANFNGCSIYDGRNSSNTWDTTWLELVASYKHSSKSNLNLGISGGKFNPIGTNYDFPETSPGYFGEISINPEIGFTSFKVGTKLSLTYLNEYSPAESGLALRWTPIIIRASF